jgi:hypothetical protein
LGFPWNHGAKPTEVNAMAAFANVLDERMSDRAPCNYAAECRIGDRLILGRVHDLSARGAFFKPELGLDDGTLFGPFEGADAALVETPLRLRLVHRASPDVEVTARVGWAGMSRSHALAGLGLIFDMK